MWMMWFLKLRVVWIVWMKKLKFIRYVWLYGLKVMFSVLIVCWLSIRRYLVLCVIVFILILCSRFIWVWVRWWLIVVLILICCIYCLISWFSSWVGVWWVCLLWFFWLLVYLRLVLLVLVMWIFDCVMVSVVVIVMYVELLGKNYYELNWNNCNWCYFGVDVGVFYIVYCWLVLVCCDLCVGWN